MGIIITKDDEMRDPDAGRERFSVEPKEHDCVECLQEDCDCGGSKMACNFCSECKERHGDEMEAYADE
jgi:hypothetical protein